MAGKRNDPLEPALPANGSIHTVRGNARNMWDKPPGQKPSSLEPPSYEVPNPR
jgi:hypothetical protein